MDNEALTEVMRDAGGRQFWIVLWGKPEFSTQANEQIFNEPVYDQSLVDKAEAMKVGDICFVYSIDNKKISFAGEVVAAPRKTKEWRQKWKWSVPVKNLTPTYGSGWRENADYIFNWASQYNTLNPENRVRLGELQYGYYDLPQGTYRRIPEGFGRFLLDRIMSIT